MPGVLAFRAHTIPGSSPPPNVFQNPIDNCTLIATPAMVRITPSRIFTIAILPMLASAARLRWMPLGDSITDYGCWRAWIWERSQKDGYDMDLVGGEKAGENCNGLDFDRDHEGHPGFQAVDIASKSQLVDWLNKSPADIITMHLGTVDTLRGGHKPDVVLAAFSKLVDQMRESNPAMRIIVGLFFLLSLTSPVPCHASPPRGPSFGPTQCAPHVNTLTDHASRVYRREMFWSYHLQGEAPAHPGTGEFGFGDGQYTPVWRS